MSFEMKTLEQKTVYREIPMLKLKASFIEMSFSEQMSCELNTHRTKLMENMRNWSIQIKTDFH